MACAILGFTDSRIVERAEKEKIGARTNLKRDKERGRYESGKRDGMESERKKNLKRENQLEKVSL